MLLSTSIGSTRRRPVIGLAGVLAILYVCGFVVVNSYLARYARTSAALLQARYLATGILFSVVVGIPTASAAITFLWDRERQNKRAESTPAVARASKWKEVIRIAVVIMVSQALLYYYWSTFLIAYLVIARNTLSEAILFAIATIWGVSSAWIVRDYLAYWSSGRSVLPMLYEAITQVVLVSSAVVSSLTLFAHVIFPNVRPEFGGGAAPVAQLVLRDSVVPWSIKRATERPVVVVDRSDGYLSFLACDSSSGSPRSHAIQESMIASIDFIPGDVVPGLPNNLMVPLSRDICTQLSLRHTH